MLPRIDSIKQMRQKIGITQKRLAGMVGVSTSMINQIESGRSRPSYETAKKIFDSLAVLEGESSSHTAGDFCSRDIVKIGPRQTLHDAIKRMHEASISQIPVFDGDEPVGLVSEDGIVKHLSEGGTDIKKTRVSEIMDAIPPMVGYTTPANLLVPLVRYSKCILILQQTKIVGIITASDTLKMME